MVELTESGLAKVRQDFSTKVNEVKQTPDKINDAVDKLKFVAPLVYFKVSEVRDDIQETLADLFEKLEEAVAGMFAPWLFLDYAAKWQVIGASVRACSGMQNSSDYSMNGRWDGSAYKSFDTRKTQQQTAMDTVDGMCTTIHDKLITVAEEGQNLYLNLVNKLATIIANVATFVEETAATAGVAAIWSVNNLNAAIVTAVELIVQLLTDFVKTEGKVYNAKQELKNLIRAPKGFDIVSSGKVSWPSSGKDLYDNKDDDWKQDGT